MPIENRGEVNSPELELYYALTSRPDEFRALLSREISSLLVAQENNADPMTIHMVSLAPRLSPGGLYDARSKEKSGTVNLVAQRVDDDKVFVTCWSRSDIFTPAVLRGAYRNDFADLDVRMLASRLYLDQTRGNL